MFTDLLWVIIILTVFNVDIKILRSFRMELIERINHRLYTMVSELLLVLNLNQVPLEYLVTLPGTWQLQACLETKYGLL